MRQTLIMLYCAADCQAGRDALPSGPDRSEGAGHSRETQWVKEGESPGPCPHCGGPTQTYTEFTSQTTKYGGSMYYSDALGVAPNQIADAKAKFPHHEFAPDGRMIIRSPQHRKQVLKDIGYADYG